jgi:hypothetical protein
MLAASVLSSRTSGSPNAFSLALDTDHARDEVPHGNGHTQIGLGLLSLVVYSSQVQLFPHVVGYHAGS